MSSLIRLVAVACSLILLASFAMFVSDQANGSSKATVARISAADDSSPTLDRSKVKVAKKKHGGVREAIDNANNKLVSPFNGITKTSSGWAQHIMELLLGLLVFGLGLGFVSRYAATKGY